ncbi:MAG: hypothetical protein FGM15_06190 [Chthoniobacterales bacterium]|nr:hypothetical protein [Chthoniobacterales bacterium]
MKQPDQPLCLLSLRACAGDQAVAPDARTLRGGSRAVCIEFMTSSFRFWRGGMLFLALTLTGSALAADAQALLPQSVELTRRWADAAFGDPATGAPPTAAFPFSFLYGGRPSSDLLGKWTRTLTEVQPDPSCRVRTLTLADPETGLTIEARITLYLDVPGVDWVLRFTNRGNRDTPILEELCALDSTLPLPSPSTVADEPVVGLMGLDGASPPPTKAHAPEPVLRRLRGSFGGPVYDLSEFTPLDDPLPVGAKVSWQPRDNRSSFQAFPFFTLDWGRGGVVTALGWTGQWTATVERRDQALRVCAGLRNLRLSLKPGESIRSPRVLQVYWEGGDQFAGYNLFRRTMLARILPRHDGEVLFPPFAHATSSFVENNKTTEAIERSYIESFKDLGFECYWLDAWWVKGGHPKGLGHWGFPITRGYDPVRFPNGIKPLSDLAHRYGLDFLLWFAPEEIWPGTDLALEHPEWVMKPGPPGPIDFTNPEALDYMTRYMNEAIQAWGVDWWRTDGAPSLHHWQSADRDNNRLGLTEIRYVEGLYAHWDALRAANPRLRLDNCAGGGRRIDLETSARALPLWRTDSAVLTIARGQPNDTAILNQASNHGLNRYLPLSQSGCIGAQPYYFRSGYNGGITFCEDTRPASYPRELLRQGIAEGKRLRPYLLGDFYPLSEPGISPTVWCVYQYHRPEKQDGVVFAFRRHDSPYPSYEARLHGLDPAATYEVVCSPSYTPEPPRQVKGRDLARLKIEIDELPGSTVIEYRKIEESVPSP